MNRDILPILTFFNSTSFNLLQHLGSSGIKSQVGQNAFVHFSQQNLVMGIVTKSIHEDHALMESLSLWIEILV